MNDNIEMIVRGLKIIIITLNDDANVPETLAKIRLISGVKSAELSRL